MTSLQVTTIRTIVETCKKDECHLWSSPKFRMKEFARGNTENLSLSKNTILYVKLMMEKSRQSPYVDLTKLAYSFNSATVSRTQRSGTVSPNMFELVSYNSSFLVDTATIFLQGTRALLVSGCYPQKAAFPVREQWPNTWSESGRKHLEPDRSA